MPSQLFPGSELRVREINISLPKKPAASTRLEWEASSRKKCRIDRPRPAAGPYGKISAGSQCGRFGFKKFREFVFQLNVEKMVPHRGP